MRPAPRSRSPRAKPCDLRPEGAQVSQQRLTSDLVAARYRPLWIPVGYLHLLRYLHATAFSQVYSPQLGRAAPDWDWAGARKPPPRAVGSAALEAVSEALEAVSAALEAVSAALKAVSAALKAVSAAPEAGSAAPKAGSAAPKEVSAAPKAGSAARKAK
jgi:hypothetical protein